MKDLMIAWTLLFVEAIVLGCCVIIRERCCGCSVRVICAVRNHSWLLPVSGGGFRKPANGSVPDAEARETGWTGSSISDLSRYGIGCESCYTSHISLTLAIGSPIRLYTAPQEMLSTIIAPCLSLLQLPAPPPPHPPLPPPLAVYIQRVRSILLHTPKPSSTYWNWTSQEKLSVSTYPFLKPKKKRLSYLCFRICCRLCRRDSWLCYGSETGFSFVPGKDRHSSTRTRKIYRLCHKRLDKGRSDNTNTTRCSRIHRSGKASSPHRSGAMGTWASFSWFCYCGVKGMSSLSYPLYFILILGTVFERFYLKERTLGSLHRRLR